MSWLSTFLNPGAGYKDALKEMEKYYQNGQGYQQPYNQQGQDQYKTLMEYINSLSHPEELQNKWAEGYSESPAAKQAEEMARQRGLEAASSQGLMGSTPATQAIQAGTAQIGIEDRQKYLDDLMQKYLAGAGLSQGIYGTGANAAGQMGQNSMNMGQNAANLKFGERMAGPDLLGKGIGAIGGVIGGPLGYGASNALAKKFGWDTKGYNPKPTSPYSPMPNYAYGS
jgi:hypothetical protein